MTLTQTEDEFDFLLRSLGRAGWGLRELELIRVEIRPVRIDPFIAGLRAGGTSVGDPPAGPCASMEPSFSPYYEWAAEITEKGRGLGIDGPRIEMATAELIEVTGVYEDPNGGTTTAEYTYRWKGTPLGLRVDALMFERSGLAIDLIGTLVPSGDPQTGKATFRLYDDGWRIVNE